MSFGFIGRKSECECLRFEKTQHRSDNFFTCDVRFKHSSGLNHSKMKPGGRCIDRKAVNADLKDELSGQVFIKTDYCVEN